MLKTALPEEVGIRSSDVYEMLSSLVKRDIHMHSLLLMRGDQVFLDCYWAPFHKDRPHRMYSATKSYVSVAVGLAEEDGLIDLDAPIASYFPEKIQEPLYPWLKDQTVREMLTMTTVRGRGDWFREQTFDRTKFYFERGGTRPSGTLWEYDSAGSQVLCALVEKVTGKKLLEYLNERIFCHLGAFQNARILSTPNGDSWGDSALICTPRDMATFARFVMNYGTWEGKRLMNEAYLRKATSRVVDNRLDGHGGTLRHGYGYQFWRTEDEGFAFVGMGDQMAICMPKQDLIMVCTSDNQGYPAARDYICSLFLDQIAYKASDKPLPENKKEEARLRSLADSLTLHAAKGAADSPWREKLHGVRYVCGENPMTWKEFSFTFESAERGELRYTNARGEMILPFDINANRFGKFPEEGYSREVGAVRTTDGHRYEDAVSGAWLQDNKLMLFVQILDDYYGNLSLLFAFKDDMAALRAVRTAEDFLWDYEGNLVAIRE